MLHRQAAERILWTRPAEHIFQQMAGDANHILEAGGSIGLGGHGELQGMQAHFEMWGLAAGGMSNHDVLRVATLESARAIGLSSEIGSLEAGKAADMLVLDDNPLQEIKNTNSVSFVMVNGVYYDAGTLDELWPKPTPLPQPWWISARPALQEPD